MADCQLGCYATFSGLDDAGVAAYAALGMRVAKVPRAEGVGWDADRLRQAVEETRRLAPDMVVMGGDMIDDPGSAEQLAELKRITARLDGIPVRWVAGNHDVAFDGAVPTPDSVAWYRRHFGPDRWHFREANAHFVAVDTTVWQRPDHVSREADAQDDFVDDALAAAEGAKHLIVFGHHPPFLEAVDEPDSYWNIPAGRRLPLLERLSAAGGCTWFAGHYHRNAIARHPGVEIVVSGPVGYPLGEDPSGIRLVEVGAEAVRHHYLALPVPPPETDA